MRSVSELEASLFNIENFRLSRATQRNTVNKQAKQQTNKQTNKLRNSRVERITHFLLSLLLCSSGQPSWLLCLLDKLLPVVLCLLCWHLSFGSCSFSPCVLPCPSSAPASTPTPSGSLSLVSQLAHHPLVGPTVWRSSEHSWQSGFVCGS